MPNTRSRFTYLLAWHLNSSYSWAMIQHRVGKTNTGWTKCRYYFAIGMWTDTCHSTALTNAVCDGIGCSSSAAQGISELLLRRGGGGAEAKDGTSGVARSEYDRRVADVVSLIEDAVIGILIQHKCSRLLLFEVDKRLHSIAPHRTVKAAAINARISPRTLQRHWRRICSSHDLKDLFDLIQLIAFVRAAGPIGRRAKLVGIDPRTAKAIAARLTGLRLEEVLFNPTAIIDTLARWLSR